MKADSRYTHQHITHQSRAHSRPHTPHSLCLDPHTTLANTYDDFRVTTYNLRLTTYTHQPNSNWDSVCWGDVRSPPPVSLSSQPASQYLRLTTYDFLAFYWDSPPPAVSHSVQSLSAASQHLRRFPSYDLRLMTSQLCFTGTHHHQQPTTTSSLSLSSIARYDLLRLDLRSIDRYDLRLTTYDLRPMTSQLCFTGTHPPPAVSQFNISLRSERASQPTLTTLSEYPLRKQTSQHTNTNHHQQSLSSISLSEYPLRKQTSQHTNTNNLLRDKYKHFNQLHIH